MTQRSLADLDGELRGWNDDDTLSAGIGNVLARLAPKWAP
jgi:hypothetical protein